MRDEGKSLAEYFNEASDQQAELRTIRAVMDKALDGIITLDTDGIIKMFNPAASRIFGYRVGEIINRSINLLIPPEAVVNHDDHLTHYRETDQCPIAGHIHEVTAQRKDGSIFPIELSVSVVQMDEGTLFVTIIRDITERKRTEQELYAAKEAAESANRAKNTFLATMSHELRTPLTAILGYSEMLAEIAETRSDAEMLGDLEKIQEASHDLLRIIDDILDVSKIEAGRLRLRVQIVDSIPIVQTCASGFELLAARKALHLVYDLPNRVPSTLTDPDRLRQILSNLLDNAVKFTDRGTITIRVRHLEDDQPATLPVNLDGTPWTLIQIIDTGIGIAPEHQSRIFTPFHQVDSRYTRRFGGTGVGLALTYELIKMMHGHIWLESQEGQGSTFSVLLPATPARIDD